MPGMENESSNVAKAEEIKLQANEAFKAHKYGQAIELYSQAIELNDQNAVYWANRAFAHTKLEEYGSAIQDATKAIEGYYRRGAAYLAMGKFKEALKDFQQVKKISPNDPDATKKLKECEKAVMKLKFEEAIAVPVSERHSVADSIDYHTIVNLACAWTDIVMSFNWDVIILTINLSTKYYADFRKVVWQLVSCSCFTSNWFLKTGASHSSPSMSTQVALAAVAVALLAALVMMVGAAAATKVAILVAVVLGTWWWGGSTGSGVFTESKMLDLEVEPQYSGAKIEGDVVTLDFVKKMMDDFKNQKCLHKRYAFQIVLQTREMLRAQPSLVDINVPDGSHFTVCGDVHGQIFQIYPFTIVFSLTNSHWNIMELYMSTSLAIYLARGNHESKSMNKIYGFEGEVKSKLNDTFVELFAEVFCCLPLAHVINQKVFVVHGGLFSVDGVKLSDIRAIDRFCEPPEEGLMCELLWSDPQPFPGRGPSKRGVGLSFGADVTKKFLQDNNLDLVVRSHEVKDEGYEIEHDGKLITVFSAPNYCDQMGNKGAFIRFKAPDLKPDIVTFSAVPHPDVKPMAYANNFLRMFQ
ncbi:Tetratricopeptide TPR-1 [Corchorus olitorius]|uniref:protein-serine/threonine phosphatase n=1 Tax=Corchorus olitorius TaxID=93759 RepID=A0A1R3GS26_9ROSI|nr:Tetratricopeptide TPR-1 [Corchorus olitorius]